MKEVYILAVIREKAGEYPDVQLSLYQDFDRAISAYGVAVDKAREDAEDEFSDIKEVDEICTDSYRFFRIYDNYNLDSITIEVQAQEIIESEDI